MLRKAGEKSASQLLVKWSGILVFSVATSFLLAGSVANSQTVTPQSVNPVQHFFDCFGVMITNPDVHAAECSPGQPGPDGSIYDMQGSCEIVLDLVDDAAGCYPTVFDDAA